MAVVKNQIVELEIESLTSEGNGVGRYQGQAIFVPLTAPEDQLKVRIVKSRKNYAYGIIEEIIKSSPYREEQHCSVYRSCGGCQLRHLQYQKELEQKQQMVQDCFDRIAKLNIDVMPILPSDLQDHYRNKVQFPVQQDADGNLKIGFFAPRSHRLIASHECLLQPTILNQIAQTACKQLQQCGVSAYDEQTHKGFLRHIYLRMGWHSQEILLCLVANGTSFPQQEQFCQKMKQQFPQIESIILNVNTEKTNVITGKECIPLLGKGSIQDTICGVPVRIDPLSFYQVNTPAAEKLYQIAGEFAQVQPNDTVLDLYCGMGTIGLSMYTKCKELIGVEVVKQAIESAKQNAQAMNATNTRFLCADAGQAAQQLLQEGLQPNIILVDPPRKGCDQKTLDAIIKMQPDRIVMISCNPATAARDVKILSENGYRVEKIQPADFFPRTKHVETVIMMTYCG